MTINIPSFPPLNVDGSEDRAMRDNTERPEAIYAGTVKLVGTSIDSIVNNTTELLKNKNKYNEMANAVNPYGDGMSSIRICKELLNI